MPPAGGFRRRPSEDLTGWVRPVGGGLARIPPALYLSLGLKCDYAIPMEIKLPQMPFKFDTPDGPMEITVRSGHQLGRGEARDLYTAAAAFIDHGPRALERIQVTAGARTHGEVMKALVTGFVVDLAAHDKAGLDYRVLEALCAAQGVEILDN